MHFRITAMRNWKETDSLLVREDFQMLYGFYPTVMIFESDI